VHPTRCWPTKRFACGRAISELGILAGTLERMAETPQDAWAGRILGGRYRLLHPIGVGGSARVFLADDVTLGRRVAVKVLHPGLADDLRFVERFRSEAQMVASLSCPQVLTVYDWGVDEVAYLVVEYLGGGSLRNLLNQGDRLSPSQALLVGLETARGLAFAHSQQLIHRDIKPDNLLFDADGRLRIADFGLARAVAEAGWTDVDGSLLGTVRYAAPEQARGDRIGPAADVYSLALVLNEAVTGTVPFVADTPVASLMARAEQPFVADPATGPLADLLSRAGSLAAEDRPSASEMVDGFLSLASSLPRPEPLPLAGIALPADPTFATTDHGPTRTSDRSGDDDESSGPGSLKRRRRFRRSLAAMAAITIGVLAAWVATRPHPVVVPDVVGLLRPEALVALDELGLTVEITEVREVGSSVDVVQRSDPSAGEKRSEGDLVTLYVSIGQPLVELPFVVDEELTVVQDMLERQGLVLGDVIEEFREDVDAGLVFAVVDPGQDVELLVGTLVEQGTVLDLRVSLGPQPRMIPAVPESADPDEARQLLDDLNLNVVVDSDYNDDVPVGQVIRFDPATGTEVPRGSDITMVVSLGPPPRPVPMVVGMSVSDATNLLREHGFEVSGVQGSPLRNVLASDPAAGEVLPFGSSVVLATSLR